MTRTFASSKPYNACSSSRICTEWATTTLARAYCRASNATCHRSDRFGVRPTALRNPRCVPPQIAMSDESTRLQPMSTSTPAARLTLRRRQENQ